jgi:hypothetical protein
MERTRRVRRTIDASPLRSAGTTTAFRREAELGTVVVVRLALDALTGGGNLGGGSGVDVDGLVAVAAVGGGDGIRDELVFLRVGVHV